MDEFTATIIANNEELGKNIDGLISKLDNLNHELITAVDMALGDNHLYSMASLNLSSVHQDFHELSDVELKKKIKNSKNYLEKKQLSIALSGKKRNLL